MFDLNHALSRADYRLELVDCTEDQKRLFLQGLTAVCSSATPNLSELRDWLLSTLQPDDLNIPEKPGREVVRREGCYQLEYVKCGKAGCKCEKGTGHGPYWYGYQKKKGKLVSKYIGKQKPNSDLPDA